MKIGKRSVLKVGLANLHYSEYEHSQVEARTFNDPMAPKALGSAGDLLKSVRYLQGLSLEAFKDLGEEILSTRENKDLNAAAIERKGKKQIDGIIPALMPAMEKAAKDMLTLAQTVASGFAAATPRTSSDIVGFLADQELRAIVRGLKPEESVSD